MDKIAEIIAARLRNGDVIGVGTGTTVAKVLGSLAEHLKKQEKAIFAVCTSTQSSQLCQHLGILPLDSTYSGQLLLGFDGADEVDPQLRAIKGKGAAMFREKIVAARCTDFIIVVDEGKKVNVLGQKFPVPVEVVPSAIEYVEKQLRILGASEIKLRDGAPGKHGPVITEFGNVILDARFGAIPDTLERDIKSIIGVVENGLFLTAATEVLVAKADGEVESISRT